MSCCGSPPKPMSSIYKSSPPIPPYNPRSQIVPDAKQATSLEYCDACESIMMLIVVAGRERKQCTNPQCRKIVR